MKVSAMKVRKRRKGSSAPVMMTELMLAFWETIARRTLLMAQNACSPAEYRRMVQEKAEAAATSASRLVSERWQSIHGLVIGTLACSSCCQRQASAEKVASKVLSELNS